MRLVHNVPPFGTLPCETERRLGSIVTGRASGAKEEEAAGDRSAQEKQVRCERECAQNSLSDNDPKHARLLAPAAQVAPPMPSLCPTQHTASLKATSPS